MEEVMLVVGMVVVEVVVLVEAVVIVVKVMLVVVAKEKFSAMASNGGWVDARPDAVDRI